MHKNLLLLKTLLLSTSQRNIYKYCKDRKKRRKIVGGTIGAAIIYAMIMVYCIAVCVGYGYVGLIDAAPVMFALVISTLAVFFTFAHSRKPGKTLGNFLYSCCMPGAVFALLTPDCKEIRGNL